MAGAKQQQQQQQQQQGKSPKGAGGPAAAGRAGFWTSALAQIAADPDRFRDQQTIWHTDDQVVGILDKYPKSSVHGLLLARQPGLDSVSMLRGEHLPLLQHMREVAVGWIRQQQQQQQQGKVSLPQLAGVSLQQQQQQQQEEEKGEKGVNEQAGPISSSSSSSILPGWRLGFHSIPSMAQLHLHILSDDFNSEWLKTKKHWNSFTSPFFLNLDDVIVALQQQGSVSVDKAAAEGLLKQGLVCHKCGQQLPNMPQLKAHILTHK
jgi:aprataxin